MLLKRTTYIDTILDFSDKEIEYAFTTRFSHPVGQNVRPQSCADDIQIYGPMKDRFDKNYLFGFFLVFF